jgi:hypothetical protein
LSKTLKQKNRPQLITFMIVNVALLGIIELGLPSAISLADEIVKGNWAILGKVIATPAVAVLVLGVIGWAIPRVWKEVLIFWRVGDRCLPSSRAFSRIARSDPRIDASKLSDQIGHFPVEPARQTSVWYSIYRQHMLEPSVQDAHSAYLLYREMVGLIATALVAILIIGTCLHIPWRLTAIASMMLVLEYAIVMLAGRHSGVHLVANVLAIASASTGAR